MKALGRDSILRKGEQLIVYSAAEMPDWQVRTYRRTAILFEGSTWYVKERRNEGPRGTRFVLEKWPEQFHDLPGRTICYDADYVANRDEYAIVEQRRSRAAGIVRVFMPLIGFLPSGVKSRIERDYSVSARSATFVSLYIEMLASLAIGYWVLMSVIVGLRHMAIAGSLDVATLLVPIVIVLVLLVDLLFRYGSYLREEDRSPYGFCEWIFRRQPRRSEP